MSQEVFDQRHLLYDRTIPAADQVARIKACLEASPNAAKLLDETEDWPNYIHRTCWIHEVGPLWILVSMQREQSLLANVARPGSWDRALGVTGQDAAGMANPLWTGLPTQILMAVRSIAWSMGFAHPERFGPPALQPSWPRFRGGRANPVLLYGPDSKPLRDGAGQKVFQGCQTPWEYAQYTFTPHRGICEANFRLYRERIFRFWPIV